MSDAKFCQGNLKVSDNGHYLDVSDADSDGAHIGKACTGVAYSESPATEMYALLERLSVFLTNKVDAENQEDCDAMSYEIDELLEKARGEV